VTTFTITIYYYSARKLILILPSHGGRRLSRPSWLVSDRDGLPARRQSPIQVLTGPAVEQLRWFDTTRCRYATPLLLCITITITIVLCCRYVDTLALVDERILCMCARRLGRVFAASMSRTVRTVSPSVRWKNTRTTTMCASTVTRTARTTAAAAHWTESVQERVMPVISPSTTTRVTSPRVCRRTHSASRDTSSTYICPPNMDRWEGKRSVLGLFVSAFLFILIIGVNVSLCQMSWKTLPQFRTCSHKTRASVTAVGPSDDTSLNVSAQCNDLNCNPDPDLRILEPKIGTPVTRLLFRIASNLHCVPKKDPRHYRL